MFKMRTIYLKVKDLKESKAFWENLFGLAPHKDSEYWVEFKMKNINFGLLPMDGFTVDEDKSNCIPVFEFQDDEMNNFMARVKKLGASVLMEPKDHPDGQSYLLADPQGNEFEVTTFHD